MFHATVELKKQISSSLRLVNSTDNYVAFKVIDSAQTSNFHFSTSLNATVLNILVKTLAPASFIVEEVMYSGYGGPKFHRRISLSLCSVIFRFLVDLFQDRVTAGI